ncbi:MAG: hypothetical protein D6769_02740 [Methanobacteriota archaeon]|nr:MAG: hypothetical protein D6769_02740 [Euryarchaeota archaeon]
MLIKDRETGRRLIENGIGKEGEDGYVELTPLEVEYAIEEGLIEGENGDVSSSARYAVYKYLMDKGYIVRECSDSSFLKVSSRGYRKGEERSTTLIRVVEGNIKKEEIIEDMRVAGRARKGLVYCFMEEKPVLVSLVRKSFP